MSDWVCFCLSSSSSRDLHIHHHTVCSPGTGSKPKASHVKTPNTVCHPVLVKQKQNEEEIDTSAILVASQRKWGKIGKNTEILRSDLMWLFQ